MISIVGRLDRCSSSFIILWIPCATQGPSPGISITGEILSPQPLLLLVGTALLPVNATYTAPGTAAHSEWGYNRTLPLRKRIFCSQGERGGFRVQIITYFSVCLSSVLYKGNGPPCGGAVLQGDLRAPKTAQGALRRCLVTMRCGNPRSRRGEKTARKGLRARPLGSEQKR